MLLINSKQSGNVLFIDRKLAELEDDAEYASFPKLTKLVKKHSNLTRTGKKKLHRPISHSLAHFVEPIGQPCFHFTKSLASLTDGLAMGKTELRGREIAVGFFG